MVAPTQPKAPEVELRGCDRVKKYDWDVRVARAICLAESSGDGNQVNMNDHHGTCSGSYSLMQVGCFWYPYYGYTSSDFFDEEVNILIAYKIFKRQKGFTAWTTYTSEKYLSFL